MIKLVAVCLWLYMVLEHLMYREWKWFTRIGLAAMWAGAVMAARRAAM